MMYVGRCCRSGKDVAKGVMFVAVFSTFLGDFKVAPNSIASAPTTTYMYLSNYKQPRQHHLRNNLDGL